MITTLQLDGDEAVNGAAAGEKLGDEARHRDLPIRLGDKRGHGAQTHHDVALVSAEDHVATGLVRLRQRDEVVKHEGDGVGQRHWHGNKPASARQGGTERERKDIGWRDCPGSGRRGE